MTSGIRLGSERQVERAGLRRARDIEDGSPPVAETRRVQALVHLSITLGGASPRTNDERIY